MALGKVSTVAEKTRLGNMSGPEGVCLCLDALPHSYCFFIGVLATITSISISEYVQNHFFYSF